VPFPAVVPQLDAESMELSGVIPKILEEVIPTMWWGHGAWGAGDWLAMSLMTVVFLAAVVALGISLLRSYRGDSARPPEDSSAGKADELLAERFARGEIVEEEFRHQRELLHSRQGDS
jgi:putative membrane protein